MKTEQTATKTEARFILRGLNVNGNTMYYSGRAGDLWLTYDPFRAFTYGSKEYAQRRARMFNNMEPVHGMRFTAMEID